MTVNIGSGGVLMTCAYKMSPGTPIKVVIKWPIQVGNACPRALHLGGTVVRPGHGLVAGRFSTHEFHISSRNWREGGSAPGIPLWGLGPIQPLVARF